MRALAVLARLVRAGLALTLLAGFATAVPWLLAQVAGWPLRWLGWTSPDTIPTLTDLTTAITSPWSDDMVLAILATCGWILWALFVRDVIVEILLAIADTSEQRAGHPPRPSASRRGPMRWAAAVLVGAILGAVLLDAARAGLGTPTAAAHTATANTAAHHPAVAIAPAHPTTAHPGLTATHGTKHASTGHTPVMVHRDRVPVWARNAPGGVHHVSKGDNLWDIAKTKLGDPYRWREIYVLNRDQPQPNGYALTDPDMIHIGWTLALPAHDPDPTPPPAAKAPATESAPSPPSGPAATSPTPPASADHAKAAPIQATSGMTGNSPATANSPHRTAAHVLTTPDEGTNRDSPAPVPSTSAADSNTLIVLADGERHTVTVVKGDNLSHLARDWLGDADRWPEIYRLNRGKYFSDVGGRLTDPDLIYPGWVLTLPIDAQPPGKPTPRRDAPVPERPPAPRQQPPAIPATPTPATSSPPATTSVPQPSAPTQEHDGVIPEPGSVAPNRSEHSADPSSDRTPTTPNDHDTYAHSAGVEVPGGWVTLPLAAALTAATALVWLRRRHRWVPEPLDEDADDADLLPPPPVITRMRRVVRATAFTQSPTQHPLSTHTAKPSHDNPTIATPRHNAADPDPTGLTGRVPPGGLGLTGDGAHAAARAALVATLSAGGPADPDASGQVIIPADALTTLLGTHAVDISGIPRLTVTASLAEALTHIEETIIERRRTLLDYNAENLDEIRTADPCYPPMPPILLISDIPPSPQRARLSSTLHLGTSLQIIGILLGTWPHELTITADGQSGGQQRMSTLDIPTTVELLGVLREAHTGQPSATTTPLATPAPVDARPEPPFPAADPAPSSPAHAEHQAPTIDDPAPVFPQPPHEATIPDAARPSESAAEDGHQPKPVSESTISPPTALIEHDRRAMARVRVLGNPVILDAGGNPIPGIRHHARQLLVYLVVYRPGAARSDICRTFWPAADQRRASGSLNTEASELRGYLRHAAGDTTLQPIINPGGRYYLNPETVTIDAWTLVDTLREAQNATDPETTTAALRRAVDAHTGILADGCDYDWIEAPRERMRRRGIRARIGLSNLLSNTDPEQAAALLRSAAECDPFSDDLARRAMHAYARLGDAAAIRRQLASLREALDELDEQPSEETTTLATTLIHQLGDPRRRRPTHAIGH